MFEKMNFWVGRAWENKSVYHAYKELAKRLSSKQVFYCVGSNETNVENSKNLLLGIVKLWRVREEPIVTHGILPTIFLSILGFETIYWVQGASAHESYLRNTSKARFLVLYLLEALAFSLTKKVVFVSDFMRGHYEKVFPWIKGISTVIICNSDLKYNGEQKAKYSYCYVGSISEWQNIELTFDVFAQILLVQPEATLYMATRDQDKLIQLLSLAKYSTIKEKVVVTTLASREDVEKFLSTKEFGFLLRDDILVNNVASPIKLAEYLSCDVNVITTNALSSFALALKKYDAGVVLNCSSEGEISEVPDMKYKPGNSVLMFNEILSS